MSRVALVVGINTYRYDDLRDLKAPAEDAEAIAQRLEKYGDFDTVIRLPEGFVRGATKPFVGKTGAVTLVELEEALENLFCPDSKQVPDTALFYFSGHGLIKKRGEGFLATSDANPNLGLNGLPLAWLRKLLQDSPIKQQLVWLDCCHSGAILNVGEADAGESGQARDRCFIAASRDFEKSYQAISSPYSVLTKALLDGLDLPQVSEKGLNNYELVAFLNEAMHGELQQPTFSNFGQPIALIRRWEEVKEQKQDVAIAAKCPYKGLAYFEDDDAQFFFGRTALTDLLLDRLRQSNFLALLGASGSGKSSVLRAGLLNQLRQGRQLSGSDRWELRVMLPTEHPLKSLAEAFVDPELGNIDRAAQLAKAEKLLAEGKEGLRHLVETSKAPRVVLVIDQFEESFTLCQDLEEREQFFACLIGALGIAADKFCLAIAMRADFFGKCVEREYAGLAKRIEALLVAVTPMNDAELREAIAKPAALVDCEVEPVLIEEIVQDVAGAPANLPLMQFALSELWQLRDGNRLTLQAYKQDLGGITGALEKRANAVYAQFTDELDKRAVKHIFLSLTQLGDGTEDTRRRVVMSNLVTATLSLEAIERVVRKLADEKLVVTDDREKGMMSGDAIVDVAHEALIRGWRLLRGWLDEDRQNLRQQRWIEDRAIEWQKSGKVKEFLLSGKQLKDSRKFQQQQMDRFPLSELAEQLLKLSKRQQKKKWTFVVAVYMAIPISVGVVIGGLAIRWWYLEIQWNVLHRCAIQATNYTQCAGRIEALRTLSQAKVSLNAINLQNADLSYANLINLDLSFSNLVHAKLRRANLIYANFSYADLSYADLSHADFSKATLRSTNLSNANLGSAYLIYADFSYADFRNANLNNANLNNANLRSTNLSNANLSNANLSNANLSNANLSNANLSNANLMNLSKFDLEIVKTTCNWEKAKMSKELREKIEKAPSSKEKTDCSRWK
jgi:uncharacterized protein YjbI with pentapeptide repeats